MIDYDKITAFDPNIIGMSVYNFSKESVYHVIEKIKQLLPNVFVCLGGPFPTYSGTEMMEKCPWIDFVVKGEGELTFRELVSQLPHIDRENLETIKGLIYREGNIIKVNENRPLIKDINSLPLPARDILRDNQLRTAQISGSRGCIAKCTFCVSGLFWKKWRGRDAITVVDEIEYIVKEYGVQAFNFCDASFEDPGGNLERMWEIARDIVRRQLNISYFADFRAEFQKKSTPGLIELLRDSGLCGACVGLESANEFDQKLYGKLATVEDNIKCVEIFRNYDINVDPGIINFNPYSDFDGLYKNIKFLEKYNYASNFDYIGSSFEMFKGAPLYLKVKRDGLLENPACSKIGYRFVDQRIEGLYKYIEAYLQKIDVETGFAINRLSYYTCSYFNLLFHLKRQFLLAHEDEGYRVTVSSQETHRAMLKPVNGQVAEWFKALLLLAEKGWNQKKSAAISQQFLNIDYINKTVSALEKNKIKLYKKLISLHLDSYIIQVR
jgi:radical SAM superfamily enzyme YgiQ (UPF0313 family)